MVDEGKELGEGLGVQAFEYGTVADHIKKYKVTCIETWGKTNNKHFTRIIDIG
jgi:aspartate carbamoyltransferase regulatory subunit